MTKELHEFLFHLRGSGFTHSTPESTKLMLYQALSQTDNHFKFIADTDGMLHGEGIDGEVGSLSDDNLTNLRNLVICVSTCFPIFTIMNHKDQERAYGITDYFIQKAETIHSYKQFDSVMGELMGEIHALITEDEEISHGPIIDKCLHYIHQNLYSPLKLNDIAAYMGYSPAYLSTLFKESLGTSIHPYVQSLKMKEAKKLLYYTDQPLTSIASALGFHSLAHLSAAFKKECGCSPSSYRKKNLFEQGL